MNLSELEQFTSQVIALQAQRKARALPHSEAELLLKINQGLPIELRERYNELIEKRRAESLTSEEHGELLRLTREVEKIEAQRAKHLAQLAKIRKTTLPDLMKTLGLQTPDYA
jgi:hypothetical protein